MADWGRAGCCTTVGEPWRTETGANGDGRRRTPGLRVPRACGEPCRPTGAIDVCGGARVSGPHQLVAFKGKPGPRRALTLPAGDPCRTKPPPGSAAASQDPACGAESP